MLGFQRVLYKMKTPTAHVQRFQHLSRRLSLCLLVKFFFLGLLVLRGIEMVASVLLSEWKTIVSLHFGRTLRYNKINGRDIVSVVISVD